MQLHQPSTDTCNRIHIDAVAFIGDPRCPNPVSTRPPHYILRIALGAMFIAHGLLLKVFVFTLPGTAQFFASLGLPEWTAYAVAGAETIGGLMLVLGIQARWVALALVPVLIGATWTHSGNGWVFSNAGGGWEYPALLTVLAFVQTLLGDGAFAMWRSVPLRSAGRTAPFGEGSPRMTEKLVLVSHHLCPYVQRAAISLTEKGVPFERRNVDLANKPDWFLVTLAARQDSGTSGCGNRHL